MVNCNKTSADHQGILQFGFKKPAVFLFIILFVALFIRLALFNGGLTDTDPSAYSQSAFHIQNGTANIEQIIKQGVARLAVLLPTAISYYLFGVSDFSASFFPMLLSLISIIVVYLLVKKTCDEKTALLSALLYAFYPTNIITSSLILPDSFIPFFVGVAILLYLNAEETPSAYKKAIFAAVAGIAIGFANMAREGSILMVAVIFIHTIINRKVKNAEILWLIAGLAATILAENYYYYMISGDPLLKLDFILSASSAAVASSLPDHSLLNYPKAMFGWDLSRFAWLGLYYYFFVAGFFYFILKRNRRVLTWLLWALFIFAALQFGSVSLSTYAPIPKVPRYLSIISIPVVIVVAHLFQEISIGNLGETIKNNKKKYKQRLVPFFILVVVITSMYGAYRVHANIIDDRKPYAKVYDFLKDKSWDRIYLVEQRWPRFLNYFFKYKISNTLNESKTSIGGPTFKTVTNQTAINDLKGAYLVIHPRFLYYDLSFRKKTKINSLPDFLYHPPDHWKLVFSYQGRPSYNSVMIYFIP